MLFFISRKKKKRWRSQYSPREKGRDSDSPWRMLRTVFHMEILKVGRGSHVSINFSLDSLENEKVWGSLTSEAKITFLFFQSRAWIFLKKKKKKMYFFIFDCPGSSLPCRDFSSCSRRDCRLSSCDEQASLCSGFSCYAPQALGVQAEQLQLAGSTDIWDPSGPGIEPWSPALAGRFLTTGAPGKPKPESFLECGEWLPLALFAISAKCLKREFCSQWCSLLG